MEDKEQKRRKATFSGAVCTKCGAIFLLFLLSVLIIACGTKAGAVNDMGTPPVTVTINLNRQQSPAPTAAAYLCGAWVTNATPAFRSGSKIPVNMKFTHLVDGVPQGVANATAAVTMTWADGYTDTATARTTADGLAVAYFTVPNRATLLNTSNVATVVFTAPDGTSCTVDGTQAAFFTFVMASPTQKAKPSPTPRRRFP